MNSPSKEAIQACHDIEGRTDDHDVRMAEIIQQAIDAATAKLREELDRHSISAAIIRDLLHNDGAGPNLSQLKRCDAMLREIAGLPQEEPK